MSENDAKVVDLDATPAQAVLLAERIAEWLLDEGVIEANSRRDALWQPSDWIPGPHWAKAVDESRDAGNAWHDRVSGVGFANRGVDLITERRVHDPGANFETPLCPICHIACNLIGDWRWKFGFAVGSFAVRFNNWPILDDAFVEEIARHLSSRWTLILGHY